MRIVIRDDSFAQDFLRYLLLIITVIGFGYLLFFKRDTLLAALFAATGACLFLLAKLALKGPVLVQIDERGVLDRRLGLGWIAWQDIAGVQIGGGYGNRVLSLKVKNPELYASRLGGMARTRIDERHDLGFRLFHLDMRDVAVNLIDLKEVIEKRIGR